ncbi:protein kinase [Streptomyces sp. NPDC057638]|uniref:protein kinase n=1 Tax=Streptomyces sp. NPDC057638 TaxID=3346190 RepID=UPI0036C2E889
MDDYAGRVLGDRYRLPLPPSDAYELAESRAFDTYSGQEVLVREVPLPEVVEAEFIEAAATAPETPSGAAAQRRALSRAGRSLTEPAVLRAIEAAQAAARIPDHPRLDQVFDVFAEDGSLWIVSERVHARPLAALLADRPLSPYRAAEVASDVLTALRVLHAHGWTHRNITARTVLVCDDGRVVLTGLASGAAEEALCGYAPVPVEFPEPPSFDEGDGGAEDDTDAGDDDGVYAYGDDEPDPYTGSAEDDDPYTGSVEGDEPYETYETPEDDRAGGSRGAYGSGVEYEGTPALEREAGPGPVRPYASPAELRHGNDGGAPDVRAARSGAIAAYRAGARAGARVGEEERGADHPVQSGHDPDWWARKPGEPGTGNLSSGGPARLAGTWSDGSGTVPDGARPLTAGGGGHPYRDSDPYGVRQRSTPRPPALPAPEPAAGGWGIAAPDTARAEAERRHVPVLSEPSVSSASSGLSGPHGSGATADPDGPAAAPVGSWDEVVAGAGTPEYRGPATPLAAERARQARIAVVGAVTERWAPEQAGPVHENWQLAAPVGPATDLWALGALLYRSVQGHAPYPEENAAELAQLVCAEPPAFAEECGPLRPVVESLLRQDPTERPDVEELSGWLRSLIRSAPEPDAGVDVVALPAPGTAPAGGGGRLPVVRRRGELVRRRRTTTDVVHGRHRHKKPRAERRGPRFLGRILVGVVLLLMAAAIAYAMLFMPKSADTGAGGGENDRRTGAEGKPAAPSAQPAPEGGPGTATPPASPAPSGSTTPGSQLPQTSTEPAKLPDGFTLRKDPEGFQIGVPEGWERRPINDIGQVRYGNGDFTLIVVPGRDSARESGGDPLAYQRDKQRELQPYRDSSWAVANGLRRIEIGRRVMAEGQFSWEDTTGRQVFVRNLVMVLGGRYHVVQVIGPDEQRDKVMAAYRVAADAYRTTR